MRMKDKVVIVIGAGQSPGEGIGNGRAASLLFAREGAKVMVVDNRQAAAQETAAKITRAGGTSFAFEADVKREASLQPVIA